MLYIVDALAPYVAGMVLVAAYFLSPLVGPSDWTLRVFLAGHGDYIALAVSVTLLYCFLVGRHLVNRLEREIEADASVDYHRRYQLAKEFLAIAGNPYFTLNYVLLLALLWLSIGPIGLGKEGQLGCGKATFLYELARIIALYGAYCLYVDFSNRLPKTYTTAAAEWSAEKRIFPLHFGGVSSEYRRLGWLLVGVCGGTAVLLLEVIKRC